MTAGTVNNSPRITEYGRFNDKKKGWKTRILVALATPMPADFEIPNALAYHEVMVSGTLTSIDLAPSFDLKM